MKLSDDIRECWAVGGKGWGSDDVERWLLKAVALEQGLKAWQALAVALEFGEQAQIDAARAATTALETK